MTPADLSRTVLRVVRRAVEQGELRGDVPERIVVERPRPGGRGDYATNAALQLARPAGRPPHEVARLLADGLVREPGIAGVEITGPGFLNLTLEDDQSVVREIRAAGLRYGHAADPTGQVFQLHFRRELRAAVWCDALRRILRAQGALVRTTCEERVPEAWAPLGLHIDAYGTPPAPGLPFTAPVPAPEQTVELGPDATRWALLHPAAHDRPRLTADEHLVQIETNPLFRVRYAHARTHALTRNAADLGCTAEPGPVPAESGKPLQAALAEYPRILAQAAEHGAPDRLARHLAVVADALLDFQYDVLPQGDEKPGAAHRARLALAEAAGTVLAGGLSLLGISAPEHL
ncbi:ArgS-related anticodon-binding protein NrtL [Streptomyces indicus]|uniref:arginine--tRNA ligase n=1 Tax=Streptomyces indicus TaxID=417292 RepID=A0A1G8WGK2_9ACTN|nr:DALR anticodon-binding domain-containing protein [Streptomyces indicus]SDJ77402.1 arginyl-tRNA synthetase [Streptomyces indicus]